MEVSVWTELCVWPGGQARWPWCGLAVLVGAGAVLADSKPKPKPKKHDQCGDCCEGQKRVVVVNGADQAVPVRVVGTESSPPFQPYQQQFPLDWAEGEDLVVGTYAVPADKRLVIEYASLFAYLQPEGQAMFVRIVTTAGGAGAFHTLAVQKQENYGVLKQFGAAHAVRIYADPGSTVQVSVGRVPANSIANSTVTLSGHFEDVP